MKKVWFTILLLIFISDLTVISQELIYAPAFKFSGTPVQWHHRPQEDSGDKQVGPILKLEQLFQYKKPLIINERVFFLLDNATMGSATGSLLICYDHTTGDSLWQNNYNPKHYGRGFELQWDFRIVSKHLEMLGSATIDTVIYGRRNWYRSFTSRLEVDTDGTDLKQQINLVIGEGLGAVDSDPPIYLEGSDFALFYRPAFPSDTSVATHGVFPYIWDRNLRHRAVQEHNILFKEPEAGYLSKLNGPVQMNPSTYAYFFSIYFNRSNTYKHFMFRINSYGKASDLKDVTKLLGEENLIIGYEKSGSRIRLKLNSPYQDRFPGNAGYLYLDAEGKILKDQRAWQIDGEVVGHVSSVDLMDSSEILHVIRFVDKHNIYFYKERADGTLYRCGELIHENEPRYAFLPKYVLQAPDRGIILTFVGALDSVYAGENFVLGGWPYICKIKGEDLMIVSGNREKQMDEYIVHPNPFGDKFRVRLPESAIGAEIRIYDSTGRRVLSRRYDCGDYELPTQDLTPGSYQVQIYRESRLVYQTTAVKTGTQ